MNIQKEDIDRYLLWGAIIAVIIFFYILLKTLLISILLSVILTAIFKPLHTKISRKIKNQYLSAITTVSIIILGIIAILATLTTIFLNQLIRLLSNENITRFINLISNYFQSDFVQEHLKTFLIELGNSTIKVATSKIFAVPTIALHVFLIFLTTYYLLIEWDQLREKLIRNLPFNNSREIIKKVERRNTKIVTGTLLIAFFETVAAGFGFWILGVKSYMVLGVLIGIFAFIPLIGPMTIWCPLALFEFLSGRIWSAIGLTALGLILSFYFDSVLRAKILGSSTGVHPLLMLFGIIGGIQLFGIIGLILGPLILMVVITIIECLPKETAS